MRQQHHPLNILFYLMILLEINQQQQQKYFIILKPYWMGQKEWKMCAKSFNSKRTLKNIQSKK